jgi:large subunit ribosomal protein L18
MAVKNKKTARRFKIKANIRSKVSGTAECPRLSVFRSNKQIYAQLIDDVNGNTLVAASSRIDAISGSKSTKVEQAFMVGKELADKAQQAGIKKVVFDRNGYLYHGRVKNLAAGAREGGLEF